MAGSRIAHTEGGVVASHVACERYELDGDYVTTTRQRSAARSNGTSNPSSGGMQAVRGASARGVRTGAGEGVSPRATRLWINIPLPARRPAAARGSPRRLPGEAYYASNTRHPPLGWHGWPGLRPDAESARAGAGTPGGWSRDAWPARPAPTRWQTRDIRSAKSPRF